jgi:hypothetical protein
VRRCACAPCTAVLAPPWTTPAPSAPPVCQDPLLVRCRTRQAVGVAACGHRRSHLVHALGQHSPHGSHTCTPKHSGLSGPSGKAACISHPTPLVSHAVGAGAHTLWCSTPTAVGEAQWGGDEAALHQRQRVPPRLQPDDVMVCPRVPFFAHLQIRAVRSVGRFFRHTFRAFHSRPPLSKELHDLSARRPSPTYRLGSPISCSGRRSGCARSFAAEQRPPSSG